MYGTPGQQIVLTTTTLQDLLQFTCATLRYCFYMGVHGQIIFAGEYVYLSYIELINHQRRVAVLIISF